MQSETQRLSVKEKVGYSVGDTASNLYFQIFMLFITYFYTDVFGISARAAATMFLIGRIWDAVNDPIMGYIADRTNTKWGKFRPYLLWIVIPLGVLGVLTFTTPGFDSTGQLIYAYITYILLTMAYTAINVPYAALMAVITPSSEERTVVSTYRFVAVFAAQFIVQYAVLRLVSIFGRGNDAAGWPWAVACLSLLAITLYIITFVTTKERVKPIQEERTPFIQDLKDLFVTNKPWVFIGIATVFQLTFIVMRSSNIMYYFKYFVQDQQMSFLGNDYSFTFEGLASTFMLSGTALTITGAILTMKFSNLFDKAKTYAGFLGLAGISTGVYYFLSPENIFLIFGLNLVFSFSVGPVSVLQWAIYTDTADYSEWKTGRRATGLLMAASLFALKLGLAIGGALLAWLLAEYGFQPNVQQTVESIKGIILIMSFYPAVFALFGVIIMWFYPLSNDMMKKIEGELAEKRKLAGVNN
jgi:GPH family glycoside/pentoside/hexuronide:cation symporter